MKQIIGTLSIILFMGVIALSAQSCNGNVSDNEKSTAVNADEASEATEASNIKVYYFHATRRCATCQAVESTTKEALTEYYGEKIPFETINREEDDSPLIAKYEISGQTLLIVKGDEVINLTNEAFLNARTSPDKFKAKLKFTIDRMLK